MERQGETSEERHRETETWRDTERRGETKQDAKQGGCETGEAWLPLEPRPRLHAQQVAHLAHPPRYPLPQHLQLAKGPLWWWDGPGPLQQGG